MENFGSCANQIAPREKNRIERKTKCIVIGPGGTETEVERIFNLEKRKMGKIELRRLFATVNAHLAEFGLDPLPETSEWAQQEASEAILNLISDLAKQVKEERDTMRSEINSVQGDLLNKSADIREEIMAVEKSINLKEQHLAEIQKQISDVQLQMGEDKKAFHLKERPKLNQIQRLEKRKAILEKRKTKPAKPPCF